jgi:hypothetical protein
MGEIPAAVFLTPLIGVILAVWMLVRRRGVMASMEEKYADMRMGDIAGRLGLAVVEGDPTLNLMLASMKHDAKDYQATGGVIAKLKGDGVKETRARLSGSPYGHPTEFVFYRRSEVSPGLALTEIRETCDYRLTLRVGAPVPDFEIVLRAPQRGLEAVPELPLALQSFGDVHLDAALKLTSSDRAIGRLLAPLVAPLASMSYVHLQGRGGVLHSIMSQHSVFAAAHHLEAMQRVLEQTACALEGRVPPAFALRPVTRHPAA